MSRRSAAAAGGSVSSCARRRRRTPTARFISAASHFAAAAATAAGWSVDYPRADVNLSIRLSELTKARVSFDAQREPNHVVVRLTDDELFQCPFIMMTEVGSAYFAEDEAERLRDYLLKGGFLWADDFWGSYAWQVWENEIRKVLPVGAVSDRRSAARSSALPRAVRRAEGAADSLDQLLDGQRRRHLGARRRQCHADAARDRRQARPADGGDDAQHRRRRFVGARRRRSRITSIDFAVDGYAVGINIVLYSMTH